MGTASKTNPLLVLCQRALTMELTEEEEEDDIFDPQIHSSFLPSRAHLAPLPVSNQYLYSL